MEEENKEDPVIETNHFFTIDGMPIFFTEDEQYAEGSNILKDEDYILENDVVLEAKYDDYLCGYMNALITQKDNII